MADTASGPHEMPFGISSGPVEYQRRQHEFLHGLPGVITIADDICVFGCCDTIEDANLDHDRNLVCLFDKCSDYDLHLSAKKLQFKAMSVTFMGHRLTNKDLEPDLAKISAITEMPWPEDKAGVQRFLGMCQSLRKQQITIHTDHRPLESIFKKPISKALRRLQQMMLKLLDYQFKVTYKKGKELYVADTLSHAALEGSSEWQQSDVFRMELVDMDLKPSNVTADTLEIIRTETSKDPVLSILHSVLMTGWPDERKSIPEEIRGFWSYREEITDDNGVLFKLDQVIVPTSLRVEMLCKIHKANQGYDSSITRARECLFWPGMQSDM
ncbi:Retrovirus-related Pol polyprotein [Stylophora pistillata]|uniref:Retrovirus-related Pol polyprotein n=1 Tax=Stylophora pistillata TaxID=50429 RepID=A0A2B4R9Z7_STYPI|nr:Retrovirus-related Pol polyprotein [Stylophora pistillata]